MKSTPVFVWQGHSVDSKTRQSGRLAAQSPAEARLLLRRQGIEVQSLQLQSRRLLRVRRKDVTSMLRQLSTLLGSGLDLLQSLQIISQNHPSSGVRHSVQYLHEEVTRGQSLYLAMCAQSQVFRQMVRQTVEAAESSGKLDSMLATLAQSLEQSDALKRKMLSASIYPISVLLVSFALILVFMFYIIPSFAQMYEAAHTSLPFATQVLLYASQGFLNHAWLVAIPIVIVGLCRYAYPRSTRLRTRLDTLLFQLPLVRRAYQLRSTSLWANTLSLLLGAGLPLLSALQAAAKSANNLYFEQHCAPMLEAVSAGHSLTESMSPSIFDASARQICAIGESSGTLDHMLAKLAQINQTEVEAYLQNLTKLMEPAIILFLGVVIGAIVMALYLPIFQIGQVL